MNAVKNMTLMDNAVIYLFTVTRSDQQMSQ